MNRRSFLTFLGIAPIAAPVAILAASDASTASTTMSLDTIRSITIRATTEGVKKSTAQIMAAARQILAEQPALCVHIDRAMHYRTRPPLTEAERIEFRRRYIDPMEAEPLESRRITHDEVCKFMGVPSKAVAP